MKDYLAEAAIIATAIIFVVTYSLLAGFVIGAAA